MSGITGLGHVALKVKDIEASLAFYQGVLGFPEMLRLHHDDGSLFLIYLRITDTAYLELFPNARTERAPGPDQNGAHHFCLTVDRLEPVLKMVTAKGGQHFAWADGTLTPADEPKIVDGLDGNRQAWLEDPDGNRIELMEMAEDCLQHQAIRRLRAGAA